MKCWTHESRLLVMGARTSAIIYMPAHFGGGIQFRLIHIKYGIYGIGLFMIEMFTIRGIPLVHSLLPQVPALMFTGSLMVERQCSYRRAELMSVGSPAEEPA